MARYLPNGTNCTLESRSSALWPGVVLGRPRVRGKDSPVKRFDLAGDSIGPLKIGPMQSFRAASCGQLNTGYVVIITNPAQVRPLAEFGIFN